MTAKTALYRCSATLISLIQGVQRINRSDRQASAETLSGLNRSPNVNHQAKSYTADQRGGNAGMRALWLAGPVQRGAKNRMPAMSALERAFCRSSAWRFVARKAVLPWALNHHSLTGDVLEIGGGSGAMAAAAAHSFGHARITVIDVDQTMVDTARLALAGFPHVNVQNADVTALPFETASFDMVTSYLMLHHVIDWQDALAEVSRVMKPGGAFIGYDLTDTRLARWVHRIDGSPHRIIAPGELADGLAAAGLTDISVRLSFRGHLMRFHGRRRRAAPPGRHSPAAARR
ncbi:MAG: class I SAM-dependent methyltransferase [Intrasporangium sp.]|uniref:class I SAM-dependent methyltransferase n=1 Tax=Intrasporangium sp. TaxID=1925024 RepID=UPI00264A3010|nr:class I SAM-dependent methyltransferase [Intrasporangium sp.]MDN5798010.1 class I SAM-dependent methyltransferase [Intrasporangium sp.]